jgi:hypothetical protein
MSINNYCNNKVYIIHNAINKDELNTLRFESDSIYKHYNNINNELKLKGIEERELINLGCSLDFFEDSRLHEYHQARTNANAYFKYVHILSILLYY